MRFRIIAVFFLIFSVLSTSAFSQTIGIGVGQRDGTYYKMAEDIQKLARCSNSGLNINIVETDGSLTILDRLNYSSQVQVGLVQADVLYYLRTQKDPALRVYENKLRKIFPLHDNEVHILASHDIENFEGLKNKKVAVGPKGSGTYLTSILLFKFNGIKPAEQLNLTPSEALAKLKSREIDAMIYVAGQPVPLFSDITENDRLHFLPVTSDSIRQSFAAGTIKKSNYHWMETDETQTVLVKNVLMSFNFQQENCQNIRKLSKIIKDNMNWLRDNGHEKWKEVNLNENSIQQWPPYSCVLDTLDQEKNYQCSSPPQNSQGTCAGGTSECRNIRDPLQRSLCELKCGG